MIQESAAGFLAVIITIMMLGSLRKLLGMMESAKAPLWKWLAGFMGVLVVRFLIETFSSPTPSFPAAPDLASLVHYVLFFFGAYLSLALVLAIFVRDVSHASKFLIFCFPIIWLAPILDLVYSHGAGATMTYVFAANGADLWHAFINGGIQGPLMGLTGGLRTEIISIVIGAALYVGIKTGNLLKAAAAGILSYCVLFLWGIVPNLVALASAGSLFPSGGVFAYLMNSFVSSHLLANFMRPSAAPSPILAAETAFNLGISSFIYFADIVLALIWLAAYRRKLFGSLYKSLRLGRIAYYYSLLAMGVFIAEFSGLGAQFSNWADALSFGCLALAYLSAFIFSTGVNDIADVDIDKINGATRPLAMGEINDREAADASFFFFAWALIGGFICGYWAFFAVLGGMAAYYAYSAPPLRFKRIPIISSFLIAVAGLSVMMAGFFFVDARKVVADFPTQLVLLMLVCITLALNFRDVKDVKGDRANDIWTIPVLLGEEKGKVVVGAMLAAAFLAIPAILGNAYLFLPSLAAAILGYVFVTMKRYREWPIFVIYFAYIGTVGAILLK